MSYEPLKINIEGGDEKRVAAEVLRALEEGQLLRELQELNKRGADLILRLRELRLAAQIRNRK